MKPKDSQYYINGILNKKRVVLSQTITLIESAKIEHREIAQQVITACLNHSGNSIRIGITGVPGVGKSTFIEAFGTHLTSLNKKVAVLAVDPTSQESRGSILGDKTRMNELSINPNAYIRPTASSNTLGGVAQKTQETIILCEAAGFDIILVETVGVGQSEIEVKSMTDFFLLLMITGAGDELQGIKRGIMEMADAIIVNKAEADNLQKAKLAARELKNSIHLFPAKKSNWIPPVKLCSAINNEGVKEIWDTILSFENQTKLNGFFLDNREKQKLNWFHKTLKNKIITDYYSKNLAQIKSTEQEILSGNTSPFDGANKL
jgi:LAO/AO transport system kinase